LVTNRPAAFCCAAVALGGGRSAAAPALSPPVGSGGDLDVFRLGALLALGDVELDLLPLLQAAVAATGDRAEVHEHVRATLDRNETVAFLAVEPLHRALCHLDLLVLDAAAPAMAAGEPVSPLCFGPPVPGH